MYILGPMLSTSKYTAFYLILPIALQDRICYHPDIESYLYLFPSFSKIKNFLCFQLFCVLTK